MIKEKKKKITHGDPLSPKLSVHSFWCNRNFRIGFPFFFSKIDLYNIVIFLLTFPGRELKEKISEMEDPDKQRKMEERVKRREQKKGGPKMKQLKV